jgi:hypothetical protein
MTSRRVCTGTNRAGDACGAPPLKGGDYCSAHDRMRPDEDRFGSHVQALAAGRLGGRPRKPRPTELARRRVEEQARAEPRRQGYLLDGGGRIIGPPAATAPIELAPMSTARFHPLSTRLDPIRDFREPRARGPVSRAFAGFHGISGVSGGRVARARARGAMSPEPESSFVRTLRRALVDDSRREIAFVMQVTALRSRGHSSDEIMQLLNAGDVPGAGRLLNGSPAQIREACSRLERAARAPASKARNRTRRTPKNARAGLRHVEQEVTGAMKRRAARPSVPAECSAGTVGAGVPETCAETRTG